MTKEREKMDLVKKMIQNSKYLVCLKGARIGEDCGCTNYRCDRNAFQMEEEYGMSPEELFNAGFYSTRMEKFFDFYKKYMISNLGEVNEGLRKLKELEDRGILKAIVTRDIFSLAKRVGCKNVLELHGSVYQNFCPHCWREYSVDYIKNSKGVPKCESCGTPIRPKIALIGEMVNNKLVTKAAEEVGKADVLLIMGCNMKTALAAMFIRYFHGSKIILINDVEHYADSAADIVIHGKPMDILAELGV